MCPFDANGYFVLTTMKKSTRASLSYGIGAALFVALIALFALGGNSQTRVAEASQGMLMTEAPSYDFGTVSMKDGNVTHRYTVTNAGPEEVIITKVYTSCMCTEANITDARGKQFQGYGMQGHGPLRKANIAVAPGERITVEAVYDPAAHGPSGIGLADRTIFLETNSVETPTFELRFRAMVTR